MAQYNFEGDIDNISERQLEFINVEFIKVRGSDNCKVIFNPVGEAGGNYVANVKRITIEDEHGIESTIAKIAPSNEFLRNLLDIHVSFNNEYIMYTEVLPKFTQLQNDAGISKEQQLKYATCYGCLVEPPNEVILLKDLKSLGFEILDRLKPLANDYIKLVLKNFAVFHSLSYVLKRDEPATYDDYKARLTDVQAIWNKNENMKVLMEIVKEDVLKVLEDPYQINIIKYIDILDVIANVSNSNKDNKHAVILHADAWTNNIMFRFEDENLAETIIIDYQLVKSGSPVYDLMFLIFNCTDYETRSKHYYDWLNYYHSELDKSLTNFNLSINNVYPRSLLDADIKQYGKLIFASSLFHADLLSRKSEDAAKIMELIKSETMLEGVHELAMSQLDEQTKILFKSKITGLIQSFVDFDL